jgi:hypothetical protein
MCAPRSGNQKGSVERLVGWVEGSFFGSPNPAVRSDTQWGPVARALLEQNYRRLQG